MSLVTLSGMVPVGFGLTLWLRRFYPWSIHGTVRTMASLPILALIFLAEDAPYTTSTELTLVSLMIALGVVLGDTITLVLASCGARYNALSDDNPTVFMPGAFPSCVNGLKPTSLIQTTKKMSLGNQETRGNDVEGATTQRPTDGQDQRGDGLQKAKLPGTTEDVHRRYAELIKGAKPTNKLSDVEARAIPNRRLEVVCRINNCFTAMESARCKIFRAEVVKVLQPGTSEHWRDWPELVEVVRTVAETELSDSKAEVNLFDAVQMTVMKAMLKMLFGKSHEVKSKDVQIRRLAKEVNRQWRLSEGHLEENVTPQWEFVRQGILKATAQEIFGEWDADDVDNPFNMILPGYETM
jgi:hypothetical protein